MTEYDFKHQPDAWVTDHNWTQVRMDLYRALSDLQVKEQYPEAVEMGKEYGRYMIQLFEKEQEYNKQHPKDLCPYHDQFGCPYAIQGYIIVERQVGTDVFNDWYRTTEHYKQMLWKSKEQTLNYYKSLLDNPERLTDTRDSTKDGFQQWRLTKSLQEADAHNRR